MNHALIVLNVLVFLGTDVLLEAAQGGRGAAHEVKTRFMIDPQALSLPQFFTYQFLHGDFGHLFGNMLFLWVFGNSVNAKMGQFAYLCFYLACGVFAGVGFALNSESPCLGASGSIAGITTAYLVLFPRANVTVFYWLWFYIGTMQIQSLILIGLKVILWDNVISPRLSGGYQFTQVAYSAHIAGYVFGFLWCSLMLLIRALPRDQYDMVAMARRAYQRHQYRVALADPNAAAQAQYGRVARPVSQWGTPEAFSSAVVPNDDVARLRMEIADLMAQRNYPAAAERYEELVSRDPQQTLSRRHMLDIANQLMTMNRYPQAASAYEKYLRAYPTDLEVQQVKLLLGILYAKYLQQYEAAQKYLRECISRLTNPDQLAQANHWLDEATTALGGGPTGAAPV